MPSQHEADMRRDRAEEIDNKEVKPFSLKSMI